MWISILNIIPSIVYPEKTQWMMTHNFVQKYQATSHIFVDTTLNFGILGSIIFFAYMGYVMQYLKSYSNGIYLAISSMFVMNLFRTFEVTLVKNIIQYSILLPLFIFALDRLISAWQKKSFIN